MKNIGVIVLSLLVLGSSPLALALPAAPLEPLGNLKWAISVEDNYVIERKLETTGTFTKCEANELNQAYGKITVGVTDYLNLYAKFGSPTGSKYSFTSSGTDIDYETDTSFLWGAGISGTYKFADTWSLIGDLQYTAWDEDIDKATYGGATGSNITNPKIENQEAQLTGLLAKDFSWGNETVFTPYIGVGLVVYNTKTKDTLTYTVPSGTVNNSWDLNGDDSVSAIVGLRAKSSANWNLLVEGRFIAETAVSGGLSYNF